MAQKFWDTYRNNSTHLNLIPLLTSTTRIRKEPQHTGDTNNVLSANFQHLVVPVDILDCVGHGIRWEEQEDPIQQISYVFQFQVRDAENGHRDNCGHSCQYGEHGR